MNLWMVFITGLTTGGLSCLAMQGGLLASVIANQKDSEIKRKSSNNKFDLRDLLPVSMFLAAKLTSHTFLGFLLGSLGSVITLSLGLQITFQVFAVIFMFATAMNLLNIHPIFRYVLIQPPKWISRSIRKVSKDDSLFAPAFLGISTIFIPCGVTQAMEVLAINSASPVQGALIMFTFVLGTSPLFAIIGVATSRFSEMFQQKFIKLAAILLIAMSLYGINSVMVVLDSPVSFQKIMWMYEKVNSYEAGFGTSPTGQIVKQMDGLQKIELIIQTQGYSPNRFQVMVGKPVELTLINHDTYSCASAFVFREFGISTYVKAGTSQVFTFTPNKTGKFIFTCSMGMYSGTMEVI